MNASRVEALAALVNVCAEAHRAPDWFVAAVKERAAARRLRGRSCAARNRPIVCRETA